MTDARTKKIGFGKRLLTAAASLVMLATCAVTAMPAHAANTAITGPSEVKIKSYLVIGKDANIPAATFTYDVTAGPEQNADATQNKGRIEAGITPGAVEVQDAVFTAGEDTTVGNVTAGGTIDASATDFKYAVKEITVDFSGVSFTAPGVYRYVIDDVTTNPATGVTCDTNQYYIDIEVQSDADGKLSIGDVGFNNGTTKVTAFVNTFASTSLTLQKEVTGNQGDRNKYFEFEVKLENAPVGSIYTLTLPTESYQSNPSQMTVGEDKTATEKVYLKDNQSIVINGLTAGTQYTIKETDYTTEGYTTTNNKNTGADADGKTTGQQTMTAADTVTFTNDKAGTVPTGILLDVAPYIVLVALVGVGIIALFATKKRRSR